MPLQFDARDWYWVVAGDSSLVYNSRRNIYVDPATDSDYGTWVTNTGASPIAAANEGEIWYYVQNVWPAWYFDTTTGKMSQPAIGAYYKGQLNNYNGVDRFAKVNGGMVAAGIPVKTDDYSRNLMQGGNQLAIANPDFHTKWFGSDGNFYDVDAAQMIEMATTVGDHTNTCYTVFQDVADKIVTNVITTPDEIDAEYVGL
jgi:hypothetical protein